MSSNSGDRADVAVTDETVRVRQLDEAAGEDASTRSLNAAIKKLFVDLPEVDGCAVISTDGLTKAAVLGEDMDQSRFGAMCASLLGLAKRAAIETRRGDLRLVLIQGREGVMLVVQIGERGVLAVSAGAKTNLGRVFHEARRVAEEIAEFL